MDTPTGRYSLGLADARLEQDESQRVPATITDDWQILERSLIDRLQSGTGTAELIETIFTIQEVISPPTLPPGTLPLDDVEL